MQTIYFDESGYTGGDLVSIEQPTFVLASLLLSESEAMGLKERFFQRVNASELKFSNIRRSPRQLDAAVNFLTDMVLNNPDKMRIGIAHKLFVGITKIADCVVENLYYEGGINFYQNGHNIAFCNALFFQTERLGKTRELVQLFSTYYNSRSRTDFLSFENYVRGLSEQDDLIRDFSEQIAAALTILGQDYFDAQPKGGLGFQGTMAVQLAGEWSHFLGERFNILYDTSRAISEYRGMLLELSGPQAPVGIHGRDRRTMMLPLKINEMTPVDSRQYVGVQLCDVLAGLMRMVTDECVMMHNSECNMTERLNDVLQELDCFPLWPTSDISPQELNTEGEEHNDLLEAVIAAHIRSSGGDLS